MDDKNSNYIENFEFYIDSPFIGNHDDMEETFKIIYHCIEEIKKSTNLRHIVIETWLIVDYFIRNALGQLFGFKDISTDDYDLRHKVLPISFDSCLDIFQDIIKIQRALPADPEEHEIRLPGQFWRYLIHDHNEFYKQLMEVISSYYNRYHPEIIKHRESEKEMKNSLEITSQIKGKSKYCYDRKWLEVYEIINDEWIKKARRINKTRNFAAHSYDSNKISEALGYNGSSAFEKAKDECLTLTERLLGLKKLES